MRVTIKLFGRLRDLVGQSDLERDLPASATAADAWHNLVQEFPGLEPYGRAVSVAVNVEFARMTSALASGDEVAFLPPVSGG